MRRRRFITLLGGAAVAWPFTARAQQPVMPVVGFLHLLSSDSIPDLVSSFREGLGETGFVEGRNVTIEFRWAGNKAERLPELAADLVRRGAAVIVSPGNRAAALAAKAATPSIPIVFGMGGDPMEAGLVASLNRPGGNATGFVELNNENVSKRLGVLHDLIPGASRFALLLDPNSLGMSVMPDLQAEASAVGLQIEALIAAGTDRGITAAFASLAQKKIDALLVNPSPSFFALREQFAALAVRHAVPVIYWDRALVQAGGLMSYGSSVADMSRQVGIYAGRILKGEKPADMPVMRATKFALVINLKAAKAIGLTIPESFLVRADEVIE
jgi:putative ABC transport system substrate-binding protein